MPPNRTIIIGKFTFTLNGEFQGLLTAEDHALMLRMNGHQAAVRMTKYGTYAVYSRKKPGYG